MLCSKCGEVVKPVVAIDIDGTLGDYHGHFWDYARQWLGIDVPDATAIYDGSEPFRDWFCRSYGVDATTFRLIKLAYRQGGMKRSMPVHHMARIMVETLRQRDGAEVWLTTTRPYLRLDNVDPDTRHWLRRHGIEYDGLLYDEDKYKVLAERVDPERVVAVLDDLPEQYDAAAASFGSTVPILRRTRYNGAIRRPNVAASLAEASETIGRRLARWNLDH